MSCTSDLQAARSCPSWWLADVEFRATLDESFLVLESSLEVEVLVTDLQSQTKILGTL